MRRLRRAGVLLAVVWLLGGFASTTSAQLNGNDESTLGGFNLAAWASGATWIYDQPGSPIPASPTAEMHAAYSLATLDTGPSGRALASMFWPGETAGTVAPFIEQSFWEGFEEGFEESGHEPPLRNPRIVPRWPIAAESAEPQGPNESEAPNARSRAQGNVAQAETGAVMLRLPGVMRVDNASSDVHNFVERVEGDGFDQVDVAVAAATSTATGIDLLRGLVEIDEVRTVAEVRSDGETARVSGRTTVSGLRIAGRGFTIDEDGIHSGDDTHDNPILGQFNQTAGGLLADEGVRMTLAEPIDIVDGAQGSRSVGGLVVTLSAHRVDELISQLPDQVEREIRSNLGFEGSDMMIVFGAANVSAAAAPEFAFDFDFGFDPGDFTPPAPSGTVEPQVLGGTIAAPTARPPVPVPSPAPAPTPAPSQVVQTQPAFAGPIDVDGVPAAAALVALFGVALVARLMKGVADTLLAAPDRAPRVR